MPFAPARLRAFVVLLTVALVATIVGAPDAGAYNGAPWFKPSSTYTSNFPDPSIVRNGGTYYAYGTSTGGAYLPVMSSTDLRTWIARPKYDPGPPLNSDPFFNDALRTPAQWAPDRNVGGRLKKEIWAPGAAKIGANYVVFYSVRQRLDRDRFCISVASSTNPLGPFDDRTSGPLVCDADPNGSIDPQPFVDPADGKPYLLWKSEGIPGSTPTRIWVRELNSAGTGFAADTAPRELLRTSQGWEGNVIENPAMVRSSTGALYLFYSGNEHLSGSYATGYATCSSMLGPCTKSGANPILASRNGRLGPGGPAPFVDAGGQLQLAYHYWNAPYTNYPSDPGCDGTDPDTGAPLCASQGQRRMAIEPVYLVNGTLRVGGTPPVSVTARAIDDSCPAGQVPAQSFSDVPAGNTHRAAIECIRWWGITQGRAGGTRYDPSAGVTRAEMAAFIARLVENSQGTLPANPPDAFPDDEQSAHEPSINKLAAVGIVGGKADGTYDPNGAVNREQMATFLVRAYEFRSGKTLTAGANVFPDVNAAPPHGPNINKAARAGFTGGRADGSYGPRLGVQRDQMASFLARVLDLLVEEGTAKTP